MGPVVGQLWKTESEHGAATEVRQLDQAALNTVGCVLSRYGRLSGRDLEILSHGETPWAAARARAALAGERSPKLTRSDLTAFFRSNDDSDEIADPGRAPSPEVARLLRGARERLSQSAKPDDVARLHRRLGGLEASKATPR
jgi:hypothetical protein